MKRKISFLLALSFLFCLTSCKGLIRIPAATTIKPIVIVPTDDNGDIIEGLAVTFECNNGTVYSRKIEGNRISKPEDPIKNYAKFEYWCTNPECTEEYDFSKQVTKNTVLYAKYTIDYMELTNAVSEIAIKSNVRVVASYSDSKYSISITTSLGSGVIVHEDSSYYYLLTNNHVVYSTKKYKTYKIVDCYQKEYEGILLANDNTYDLAFMAFKKNSDNKQLTAIEFASEHRLDVGETVIAMGEPNGQSNTVTYGTVKSTDNKFVPQADTADASNVTFEVITHSAKVDHGSSGGALIDTNLKLVGINFASSVDKSNNYIQTYTVPIHKVNEFLVLKGFKE